MNKRFTFVSWKWGLFFLKKGNLIFPIKLGQRLPKSFSELHVKNSRLFLSYFLEKNDWPKAYTGPRQPTLPYPVKKPEKAFFVEPPNSGVFFHWDHFCEDHLSELFSRGLFIWGFFFQVTFFGDFFSRNFFPVFVKISWPTYLNYENRYHKAREPVLLKNKRKCEKRCLLIRVGNSSRRLPVR